MQDINPSDHLLAYIFGTPGLLAFLMTLGLWLATICVAVLA